MTDFLHAIILGAVQGVSEFLPISSSAHLILMNWFLTEESISIELEVALHFGTFLALLLYFRKYWFSLINSLWRRIRYSEKSYMSSTVFPALVIGSIPAAFFGLLFKDFIESFFYNPSSILLPLAFVGIALWVSDLYAPEKKKLSSLTLRDAFFIGIFQSLALIPGVSRSGSTIIGGRLLGYNRKESVEFSFILGTPVMFGAALLHAKGIASHIDSPIFYFGILVSFFVGYLTIKYFLKFVSKFNFLFFAIYRLTLSFLIAFLLFTAS